MPLHRPPRVRPLALGSLLAAALAGLAGCVAPPAAPTQAATAPAATPATPPAASPTASLASLSELQRQVVDAERAFARTMADRDHAAFTSFLSDEAVFFSTSEPLRGKAAVAAFWRRFYETPEAPFSWQPQRVQVLDSGRLALSTGPVFDPAGKPIASFTSVWRLEAPGVWRILFDNGCNCP